MFRGICFTSIYSRHTSSQFCNLEVTRVGYTILENFEENKTKLKLRCNGDRSTISFR